jgi:hypothetical protein
MRSNIVLIAFVVILANTDLSLGQEIKDTSLLADNIKTYISDGQDHILYMKKNVPTRINAIFYPKFNYKIAIEPENKDLQIEINFLDQHGNVHFSNTNKKYAKEWIFTFLSLMPVTIELKIKNNTDKKEEQVHLAISYLIIED